jgi:hypothetical protein
MVNINEFKVYTEFLSNKAQIGNSITIPQFNEICQRAQMQVFEKDRAIFIAKKDISGFLKLFLKNIVTSVPPDGILNYPSDYEHTASVRSYYVRMFGQSVEIEVPEVKNKDWGKISSSLLQTPTRRFPKYSELNEYRFLPRNIGTVMIDYFKTPIAPVWAYTIVNGRPLYDPIASVDFEFDSFAVNSVAACFLSLLGVNLRDGDLENFSNQYKKETNSIL